jgi:hypothetical protein
LIKEDIGYNSWTVRSLEYSCALSFNPDMPTMYEEACKHAKVCNGFRAGESTYIDKDKENVPIGAAAHYRKDKYTPQDRVRRYAVYYATDPVTLTYLKITCGMPSVITLLEDTEIDPAQGL